MGYLRAKSRLRRLRYETRLRAQSFVTIFLSDGGSFSGFSTVLAFPRFSEKTCLSPLPNREKLLYNNLIFVKKEFLSHD